MAKEEISMEEAFSMDAFSINGVEHLSDEQEVFDKMEPMQELDGGEKSSEDKKSDEDEKSSEKKENKADSDNQKENVGKEVKSEKTSEKSDSEEDNSSSTVSAKKLYSSFAKTLKNQGGVFDSLDLNDDEEVASVSQLSEKLESLIQKRLDESLDDFQKEFKEALNIGMPADEFKQIQYKIQQLDEVPEDYLTGENEENIEFRVNIIKNNLIMQGMDETKAEKYAKATLNDKSDVEEAKSALEEMKTHYDKLYKTKKEDYKKQSLEAEKEQKNSFSKYEEKVKSTNKIADFEIDDNLKKKIIDNTTKIVSKKDGRPLNALMKARLDNPEDFDMKLSWIYSVTKGLKDFSYFTGKGKKEATSDFDKLLQSASNKLGFDFGSEESFSILDNVDENESIF